MFCIETGTEKSLIHSVMCAQAICGYWALSAKKNYFLTVKLIGGTNGVRYLAPHLLVVVTQMSPMMQPPTL